MCLGNSSVTQYIVNPLKVRLMPFLNNNSNSNNNGGGGGGERQMDLFYVRTCNNKSENWCSLNIYYVTGTVLKSPMWIISHNPQQSCELDPVIMHVGKPKHMGLWTCSRSDKLGSGRAETQMQVFWV